MLIHALMFIHVIYVFIYWQIGMAVVFPKDLCGGGMSQIHLFTGGYILRCMSVIG